MTKEPRSLGRALRWPFATVVAYSVLRAAFALASEDDGLLTPGGAPRLPVVALGIATLALRVAVIVLLPALLTYGAVAWLGDRASGE